ncbi:hypothetical protein L208DRAFT_1284172, partial [Tricholoma matsutake]
CFLCENECATYNLAVSQECTFCSPSIFLPCSVQRVLEHMSTHILFDPSVDQSAEPCGLCLCPLPLCIYYLKRGKGVAASEQVNFAASVCPNKIPFSYAVAAISTASSPSLNIHMCCPICPVAAPCVW